MHFNSDCAFDVPSAETPTQHGNVCPTGGAMDSPSIRAVRLPWLGSSSDQSVVLTLPTLGNKTETRELYIKS